MATTVAVGNAYHTGEKSPVSGRFEFVRHSNPDSHCEPPAEAQGLAARPRGDAPPLARPVRPARSGASPKSNEAVARIPIRALPALSPPGTAGVLPAIFVIC